MPVHIEEVNSEVSFAEGAMPLSDEQMEMIVKKVKEALARDEHEAKAIGDATGLRTRASLPSTIE